MAWTTIPDQNLEPGKPIRSVDGLALRDNPIAIANGDPGAPKITTQSMAINSINGDRISIGSIPGDRLPSAIGAVGTYVFAFSLLPDALSPGATVAGSALSPSNVGSEPSAGSVLTGTWRCMGRTWATGNPGYTPEYSTTLFYRIS